LTTSLVVQTSFLGDMVLTTPLIARLAEHGAVDVLATKAAAALLANNPSVRETIVYDKRGTDRGVSGFRRVAARLREGHYTAAYHAQGSVRSGALTLAAGIRDRVGFASSAGRHFYTCRIPSLENVHHAARLLSLATRDPLYAPSRAELRPHLYPGHDERVRVDDVLGTASAGRQLIALAPGSVWATKQWPYYADLARELSDDSQIVIGRAALLVTNDSAPQHLASAMNTPTVAVFGPTVPEFGFGPLAERVAIAGRSDLECRPCDKHGPRVCPLGHWRCMREITPDAVALLARGLLTSRNS